VSRFIPSNRLVTMLVAAPFVIAACSGDDAGGATADPATAAPATTTAAPSEATGAGPEATDVARGATDEATSTSGTWLDIELTDAETGEPFTLASLQGQVVAIEPMAIWCPSCKRQQDNVKAIYPDIEASGVRFISLGIDPAEDPDALARYAERNGYEWTFAPSPTEFSRALSDLFGAQILSAPSTPLIVLDADGELVSQLFGSHSPDQLRAILDEAAA
jgi:cytochrome oxidase Cu insertion factor (SCO1/SenC/PrrC family)